MFWFPNQAFPDQYFLAIDLQYRGAHRCHVPAKFKFPEFVSVEEIRFRGFPVLRTISRKMSFPKFSDNYRCFQRIKIFLSKFLEWKQALNSKLQTCTFEFQHENRIWTLIQSFQLRWLKIKGIHAAFPSLITLLSHHLK